MVLEIAAYSVQAAIIAWQAGADRIELCSGPAEGGLTPGIGTIKETIRRISIPVFVIIRPREGDFLYSDAEFEAMKEDIRMAKISGAKGIVTGVLTPDGLPDIRRLSEIVELAGDLPVTFHRAFDMVRIPHDALEMVIGCGVQRILTSGSRKTAEDGIHEISALVRQAEGRIIIMPGSGIHAGNAMKIADATGCTEFHMSAKYWADGFMQFRNPEPTMGGGPATGEYGQWLPDPGIIHSVRTNLGIQGFE